MQYKFSTQLIMEYWINKDILRQSISLISEIIISSVSSMSSWYTPFLTDNKATVPKLHETWRYSLWTNVKIPTERNHFPQFVFWFPGENLSFDFPLSCMLPLLTSCNSTGDFTTFVHKLWITVDTKNHLRVFFFLVGDEGRAKHNLTCPLIFRSVIQSEKSWIFRCHLCKVYQDSR